MGKVALCLPGGGCRAILTVGFLKAWRDLGLKYDFISGTSAGALDAVLFAQEGNNTDFLESIWLQIGAEDIYSVDTFNLLSPFSKKQGLLSSKPLQKTLHKYLDFNKIKACPTPIYVNTTNYTKWKPFTLDIRELSTKEEMVKFITASASIPMAFSPVNWAGDWLYDGGMINCFGIKDSIDRGADTIVVLRPVLPGFGTPINSVIDAFKLSMSIPQEYVIDRELATVELVNRVQEPDPDLRHINVVVVQPTKPPEFDILDFDFGGKLREEIINDAYFLAYPILKKAFK